MNEPQLLDHWGCKVDACYLCGSEDTKGYFEADLGEDYDDEQRYVYHCEVCCNIVGFGDDKIAAITTNMILRKQELLEHHFKVLTAHLKVMESRIELANKALAMLIARADGN